ncbi:MAG: exodeoxyribonuclease III [Ferrovibrio sp.]|uniref:exodeoxyribonuclease III n=1 Tax=Ferrovibrio sp. TaxID=1917215 RepID=UPI00262DC8FF|nr:exodeoxyribonuclease III [Ferrovibrio sp.]MCW0236416.1 exodeoxyribonuclease III [Ferrovibrio sp.]
MRLATWNVNSVKARLPNVVGWLRDVKPDVAVLQEIKCQDADFPRLEFESLGYRVFTHGQKSYNGVALLSLIEPEAVRTRLPGDDADEQSRYIEGDIAGITVCGLYLPNGNPRPGEKYEYKLRWMERLRQRAIALLQGDRPFLLTGDFNICPEDVDVFDPVGFAEDALCAPDSRRAWRALCNLGLTEAWRALHPREIDYSFWDYQAGCWPRNNGLRIDHFLLSPVLADRLVSCEIDRGPRGQDKASDHTPVLCELRDA